MNSKNLLIAIGVLLIGVILYKLLLGFVLPIALFVALGYVLKFLLKGSESDSGKDLSQISKNSEPPSPIDNIVEIQPIEEDKTAETTNPIEEDKIAETTNPIEEDKIADVDKDLDEEKIARENKPIDEDNSSGEVNIS